MKMIGKSILHYKILEKLGQGGMGVVYKAGDTKLQRTVAIKFLPQDLTRNTEAKQRFIQEARAASALDHPNICTIYEFNETEDGQLFMVMAYYDDKSLKDKIIRGPLNPEEAIDIAIQVAEGLKKAHSRGIIHRDIKPSNIMITSDGIVKIVDFGLAKLSRGSRLTKDGTTLGTVAYMSPEQTYGEDVDHRSDIWSLGVVMYEMLTGKLPFRGEYEQAIIYSIVNEQPEPLSNFRDDVSDGLERIIRKALAKNPGDRYQQVTEMLDDLKTVAMGVELPGTALKSRSIIINILHRRRILRYSLALFMLFLIIVSGLYLLPNKKEAIASIAVLPLDNYSGDPEQEYFSDGMTDLLISNLAQISSLSVISRGSVMHYKGQNRPLKEIARELGVDAVVQGSFVTSEDRVRITAHLTEIATERLLMSRTYDYERKDILKLQSEVAQTIAEEIEIQVTPEEKTRLTSAQSINPDAHEAYLKGLFHFNKITFDGWEKSIEYFSRAIEIDPNFALAYAGLAVSYQFILVHSPTAGKHTKFEMKRAALRALQLDESIGDVHRVLALIKVTEWDIDGAEDEYKMAIQLNPSDALARTLYAQLLNIKGKHDLSLEQSKIAKRLDPLNLFNAMNLAYRYFLAKKYDAAIDEAMSVLDLDPNFGYAYSTLGGVYLKTGKEREAIEALEKAYALQKDDLGIMAGLGNAYGRVGEVEKAKGMLERIAQLTKESQKGNFARAQIYAGLQQIDEAYKWLERAYEAREYGLLWIDVLDQENLRSDPRYDSLLKRIGLRNSD